MGKLVRAAFLVVLLLLPVASAAADTSASLQFVVHATVAPARYIIVNSKGQITELIANSKLQVQPTVYLGSIKAGNQQLLTPDISSQYQEILRQVPTDAIGIIYNAPAATNNNPPTASEDPANPSLNPKLPFLFLSSKS